MSACDLRRQPLGLLREPIGSERQFTAARKRLLIQLRRDLRDAAQRRRLAGSRCIPVFHHAYALGGIHAAFFGAALISREEYERLERRLDRINTARIGRAVLSTRRDA